MTGPIDREGGDQCDASRQLRHVHGHQGLLPNERTKGTKSDNIFFTNLRKHKYFSYSNNGEQLSRKYSEAGLGAIPGRFQAGRRHQDGGGRPGLSGAGRRGARIRMADR